MVLGTKSAVLIRCLIGGNELHHGSDQFFVEVAVSPMLQAIYWKAGRGIVRMLSQRIA